MKKTRYTEEQIAFSPHQAQTRTRAKEVRRKIGISEATFYIRKRRYDGLGVDKLRRLKQLKDESQRLKRMVDDLSLDKQMLQHVLTKKLQGPPNAWNS